MPNDNLLQLDQVDDYRLSFAVAKTSYTEYLRSGTNVTDIIIWTSAAKVTKIREWNYIYSGGRPTSIATKQYDGVGSLIETLTESLSYSGSNLDNITATLT